MAIEAEKIDPLHQNFLDMHFGISPQWTDFHKKLKDPSFISAVKSDTRSDDKLKAFVQAVGMRDQAKGKSVKAPSDSNGSYKIKYHPQANRFSCTCPDWTYKQSVGGGECKHIQRMKAGSRENLMKTKKAEMGPIDAAFRVARTIGREHKDKAVTQKLQAENTALSQAYPRPSFISEYLKHAEDVEWAKKIGQAARALLA